MLHSEIVYILWMENLSLCTEESMNNLNGRNIILNSMDEQEQ